MNDGAEDWMGRGMGNYVLYSKVWYTVHSAVPVRNPEEIITNTQHHVYTTIDQ